MNFIDKRVGRFIGTLIIYQLYCFLQEIIFFVLELFERQHDMIDRNNVNSLLRILIKCYTNIITSVFGKVTPQSNIIWPPFKPKIKNGNNIIYITLFKYK